jgi:hypothetical protein
VRILFAMCTLFVGAVSDIVSSICCEFVPVCFVVVCVCLSVLYESEFGFGVDCDAYRKMIRCECLYCLPGSLWVEIRCDCRNIR